MYDFIDTTGQSQEAALPSEAMNYNGLFIENEIPGYRTLSVSGRESIEAEITDMETSMVDGSYYLRKRYKPRTITVTYQLLALSSTAFRNAYNRLNAILDAEQVEIYFNDEPDKAYTGTKVRLTDPPEGSNSVTGKIEIYCPNPFKHSLNLYEVTADENDEIVLNYDGTAPGWPILKAEAASDLGYVSFVDGDGHVLQVGDPEELDEANHPKMETLILDLFRVEDKLATWSDNNAALESDVSAYRQQGSVKKTADGMEVNSFGTDRDVRYGPSKTKAVPADSAQHTGAANCSYSFSLKMYAASAKMAQEIIAEMSGTVNGVKTVIASMHITKSGTGNFNGNIYLYVMGKQKKAIPWNAAKGNKWFDQDGSDCHCTIRKDGNKFTFSIHGEAPFETKVAGTEDYEVTEISLFFNKKKGIPAVTKCAVRSVIFDSYSVENWWDVPNKFKAGDEITCQTADGLIMVNDIPEDGLGALGNDWEEFTLKPGVNTIKCLYSDWAEKPAFKMLYTKVYL